MKFLKWFSLFFVSMGFAFLIGMVVGVRFYKFFYPGNESDTPPIVQTEKTERNIGFVEEMERVKSGELTAVVSENKDCIDADTVYICIERDLYTGDEVQIATRVPHLYLGMNREQFVECMENYAANPPLSERERGFVSLEVIRFSPQEVEVLMNYEYVKPSDTFYIMVYEGKLVVLLDDKKTVYMQTGIDVFDLPEEVHQNVIQGLFVPSEQVLYDFLESYTS